MSDLSIRLRTDLEPYEDFHSVQLIVYREDKPWKRPQVLVANAPEELSRGSEANVFYVRKVRKNRKNLLDLRLLNRDGAGVAHRTMHITPTSRRHRVQFVINRA